MKGAILTKNRVIFGLYVGDETQHLFHRNLGFLSFVKLESFKKWIINQLE